MLKHWPVIFLLLITLILAYLNFQPGTFLIGWDNLTFEFNPLLNLRRSLDSTWQEYQSLGLPAGMAHAAGLPLALIIWFLSLFTPLNLIRYLTTFTLLALGPVGVYYLARATLLSKLPTSTQKTAAFLAGLFYLLNLVAVQTFYLPFEAFTFFYAGLPWILLSLFSYLRHPRLTSYFFWLLTNLVFATAFYVQTNFLVLGLALVPIFLYFLFRRRFIPVITALLSLFLAHAYWLLPAVNSALTSAQFTIESPANQIATREIIARNQAYSGLKDIALLKGFWFSYVDLNSSGQFDYLMTPWINHLNLPIISFIGYSLFVLILIGAIYSIKRRLPYTPIFLSILLLSIIFLAHPSFSSPLGRQLFRSVFTKWSIPASLSYSLFLSAATVPLLGLFSRLSSRLGNLLLIFSFSLILLLFAAPAFQGHLISPSMRQSLPLAYLDLFTYLNRQDPNTRLANFPQHTIWGWHHHSWGGRGSGFLWYGLPQPILDRSFDVWSPASSQYYQAAKTALYAQDLTAFEQLVEKYSISWILIDESIIIAGQENQTPLYNQELKSLLNRSSKIKLATRFDFLSLYRVNLETKPINFFSTPNLPSQSAPITSIGPTLIANTPPSNHSSLTGPKNCDPFNSIAFTRTVAADSLTYSATGANSCDHFLYPELSHQTGYQIAIEHRNLKGSPFLVCLEDYASQSCLTYTYLPPSPDWTTTTLEIPPLNPSESGYTLHLYTYSIGRQKSTNAWRSITIRSLTQTAAAVPKEVGPLDQEVRPLDLLTTGKPAFSLYALKTDLRQSSLLTLNQAFDPGWKAYLVDSAMVKSPTWSWYLLSLLLTPLGENQHLTINSWANGWLLPAGTRNLLIVYQPQLLQILGFSLLFFLPLIPLLMTQKPRKEAGDLPAQRVTSSLPGSSYH